ncbi:MAG: hypothetical protein IKE70_04745, partial [Bacilli bacterium]|nr:hypothetical protein [Bacilli bacterium]
MEGVLSNNKVFSYPMEKTKERKEKALDLLKSKLEKAKLELIYTELEENQIPFERNYSSVKELTSDLREKLNSLDYNKVKSIKEKVENSLNSLTEELEKGSTNAFTKLMTSDLSKSIAKTLGISLAGRTALILAPTIGTKALVATGLAGYGVYKMIKNRKQIIEINETNELNNILQELEVTKDDQNNYLDTRFNEKIQEEIKEYLKNNNITYEDTGYRSLRQTIYSLDNSKKKDLCNFINSKYSKGIDVEERIKKAKKKLNVVTSSIGGITAGATLGAQLANTVNAIDPALTAGVLNGTVLSSWIENASGKEWLSKLTGGLSLIGTEVAQHIPVIGSAATKLFAAENLAAFASVGAVGGLVTTASLGVASLIKGIHDKNKSKKEIEKYLKLDREKYQEEDKEELEKIEKNLKEPKNLLESSIVDIVYGSLKEENIKLENTPRSIDDLKKEIEKLPKEQKEKGKLILNNINNQLKNNPKFSEQLKKAGKISIALLTTGLAAMSVYDIISGGAFLPELSRELFPNNNIHTPVEVPEPIDTKLDSSDPKELTILEKGKETYNKFNTDEYKTEYNGDYIQKYGANYIGENPSLVGTQAGMQMMSAGQDMNFIDNILNKLGLYTPEYKTVPDIPKIASKLDTLSPQELYEFYRSINTIQDTENPIYTAVKEVLSYKNMLEKVST